MPFYDVTNGTTKKLTLDVGDIPAGASKTLFLSATEVTAFRKSGMTVVDNSSVASAVDTDGRTITRDDAPGKIVVVKTAAFTLAPEDSGKIFVLNNAADQVVTAPPTLPVGFNCKIVQGLAGQASVVTSGSGAVRPATSGHTGTAAQYSITDVLVYQNTGGSAAQVSISGNTATVS